MMCHDVHEADAAFLFFRLREHPRSVIIDSRQEVFLAEDLN